MPFLAEDCCLHLCYRPGAVKPLVVDALHFGKEERKGIGEREIGADIRNTVLTVTELEVPDHTVIHVPTLSRG